MCVVSLADCADVGPINHARQTDGDEMPCGRARFAITPLPLIPRKKKEKQTKNYRVLCVSVGLSICQAGWGMLVYSAAHFAPIDDPNVNRVLH